MKSGKSRQARKLSNRKEWLGRAVAEALEGRVLLSGVTIITHGFRGDMNWVNEMASLLTWRSVTML